MEPLPPPKEFVYSRSGELDLDVRVRIMSAQGLSIERSALKRLEDPFDNYQYRYNGDKSSLLATCQLFSHNRPLGLAVTTAANHNEDKWKWEETLVLPVMYSTLPRHTLLAITLWGPSGPGKKKPIGGTTVAMFTKNGQLRRGLQHLKLWEGKEADGSEQSTTYGKMKVSQELRDVRKAAKQMNRNEGFKVPFLEAKVADKTEKLERAAQDTKGAMLLIEFPPFERAVVFYEQYTQPPPSITSLTGIDDPEMDLDNPAEIVHRLLTRGLRDEKFAEKLKPNPKERDRLQEIMRYPPTKSLTTREKDLIWKFRYPISRDKKALTFFLKCIYWTDEEQAKQGTAMLKRWQVIGIDDALELLSDSFTDQDVRSYAVQQLGQAKDEELLLYLLQLVQALKFEPWTIDSKRRWKSPLGDFLVEKALTNRYLGNYLYWYVTVETQDTQIKDTQHEAMYKGLLANFCDDLLKSQEGQATYENLQRQMHLVDSLCDLGKEMRRSREAHVKKIEKLGHTLSSSNGLHSFEQCSLPLDPSIDIVGIDPSTAEVFKSEMVPLLLDFKTTSSEKYRVIFKTGDDLRQDQLVIQMINLMDQLLKKENLNLRLTPYKVLATGLDHGMVQFVHNSMPVAVVLRKYDQIQNYFKHVAYDEKAPYNIKPDVMETYIRSCAGYCVITYLLGIGDRHNDNLMLTPEGNLLHIDFGYILGRDPKPFAPPMKLSRAMVEGMGGVSSAEYRRFYSFSQTAFLALRRNASLILNLLSLMASSSIKDIHLEPEKVLEKVQDKLRVDLGEQEAMVSLQNVIKESATALFPEAAEKLHEYVQFLRK